MGRLVCCPMRSRDSCCRLHLRDCLANLVPNARHKGRLNVSSAMSVGELAYLSLVLKTANRMEDRVSRRVLFNLVIALMFSGEAVLLSVTEARAQNPHDFALHKAITAAQHKMVAAAKAGDDDALASIYRNSMLELFLYKKKYNIPDEVAQNPCQRAYEELSASAIFLASYIQPNRKISGPIDRVGDGCAADKWWMSHREAFAECERLLKIHQSPLVGPGPLTSIVPR